MLFIYFLILFILSATPFACACVPQTFLFYPMNAIVLLSFTGMLFFRKFRPKHIIYYILTAFCVGFIFPAIPVFMTFTLPAGLILFITAFSEDKKGHSGGTPSIAYGCAVIILLFAIVSIPLLIIPAILGAIILFSLRRKKTGHEELYGIDSHSDEVPGAQKLIAGIIFILVLLTAPVYAIYVGTDVKAILLFFSLLMLVLGIIFIRSIIRKSGIPREEWISRLVVSGLLFFTVAGITLNIKMNSFFGSNMGNYISVLAVKKMQLLVVFFMLLIVPVLFIYEDYLVKRKLSAIVKDMSQAAM